MARSHEEERRSRRRRRLTRGLLLGAAAFGLPALYNAWVARRTAELTYPSWQAPEELQTSLGRVAVRRLGEERPGGPIVLLHSLAPGHSSSHWQAVGRRLAAHRSVVLFDWPGWGDSQRGPYEYAPVSLAAVLQEVLDAGPRPSAPVAVVAAGLAAAPAVRFANRFPDRLRSLTLVCPRGAEGSRPALRDRLLRGMLGLPVLGTSAIHLATSRRALETQLVASFHDPHRIPEDLLDEHEKLSHLPGSRHPLTAYLTGGLDDGVLDRWARLPLGELHLIWGREARSPEVVDADLWLKRRGAALHVVEGAGSLPHLERPEATAELLRSILS
ncbi:MAG: alpha/beta fold hydrolase [Acidobacteria bacterium]|nr:MAG: alpha/beta fold hydrolase [Acidobacteriota bacterium]REK10140.1 MAG: alpha/beta fold hydrolase [Acidobacteriota bacterium]